jgi:hypothetical protein
VGLYGSRAAPAGSGGTRMPHGGASVAPRRRSPILCYGGQISIWFGPMASQWRGESIFAHLERRWRLATVAQFGCTLVTAGACSEGRFVLLSWSNSGCATSWNSLGGHRGLESQQVVARHAVVVARIACFDLMKNWSGTTPFIWIFSLLLMLDANSISTRILF